LNDGLRLKNVTMTTLKRRDDDFKTSRRRLKNVF